MNPIPDKLDFPIDIEQQKAAIRREMLAQLKELSRTDRARCSRRILDNLLSGEAWQAASTVLIFHPLNSEPDVAPLLEDANREILLTRVTEDGLDVHRYSGPDSLRRSNFGMLEPDPDKSTTVSAAEIDLAVIPGLAFDPNTRVRLGRGGGFYDRLLAGEPFRATTIGVAFDFQVIPNLPAEPHDRPVDAIVTPSAS